MFRGELAVEPVYNHNKIKGAPASKCQTGTTLVGSPPTLLKFFWRSLQ